MADIAITDQADKDFLDRVTEVMATFAGLADDLTAQNDMCMQIEAERDDVAARFRALLVTYDATLFAGLEATLTDAEYVRDVNGDITNVRTNGDVS